MRLRPHCSDKRDEPDHEARKRAVMESGQHRHRA
jgi:hypothetical protein